MNVIKRNKSHKAKNIGAHPNKLITGIAIRIELITATKYDNIILSKIIKSKCIIDIKNNAS